MANSTPTRTSFKPGHKPSLESRQKQGATRKALYAAGKLAVPGPEYTQTPEARANWQASLPVKPCKHCGQSFKLATPRQQYCKTCSPNLIASKRLYRYCISQPDWDRMYAAQDGCCAICKRPFDQVQSCIDHNHACDHPGKGKNSCQACVRGLLCLFCNARLAHIEDVQWLKQATAYLDG